MMKKTWFFLLVFTVLGIVHNHALALCVNVPEANLRKGPGTQHEKTWEVFKYMPFKRLSTKGEWYKVQDVDKYESFKVIQRKGLWVKVLDEFNDTGWIFRKLLWIY
jgi:uncharacterized protein YgiM (DUF1202 family)